MKKLFLNILIFLLFSPLAFSQSKKIWEETQSKNTISAYTDFLQKYPDSKYSVRAKQNIEFIESQIIDSLDWKRADSINTAVSYEQYFIKHKHSQNTKRAKSKYIELILKNSLPLSQDEIERIKQKSNIPLSQVEIERITDDLQLCALPFSIVELQSFFTNNSNSSGQFNKNFNTLEASFSSSEYAFKNVVRPNSSLYTHCLAFKYKVEILTTTLPMSMLDALDSDNGIPPKSLNPKMLFVLSQPIKDNINTIGFAEIKIFKSNGEIQLHLKFTNGEWFSIE